MMEFRAAVIVSPNESRLLRFPLRRIQNCVAGEILPRSEGLNMGVITISRQFGCAANEIAAKVAEALGYEVVDKELLAHVAAEAQASEEEVAKYDEACLSPIERFLRTLVKFATPEESVNLVARTTQGNSILAAHKGAMAA
jgi:hypothetical protein